MLKIYPSLLDMWFDILARQAINAVLLERALADRHDDSAMRVASYLRVNLPVTRRANLLELKWGAEDNVTFFLPEFGIIKSRRYNK